MNYLITGVGGFIGSSLAEELLKQGHKVIGLDNFDFKYAYGNFSNIPLEVHYLSVDVRNTDIIKAIITFHQIDKIFHLGAISDTRVQDKDLLLGVNYLATRDLIELSQQMDIPLTYASSASVYGNNGNVTNAYALSKLRTDDYVIDKSYNNVVGLRFFNVFGANEFYKGVTSSMVYQILNSKDKVIKLFDGSPRRDFIYIKDIVKFLINVTDYGIYNCGTGKAELFEQIIHSINRYSNRDLQIKIIPNPYTDNSYQFFTQAETNLKCDYTLDRGIKDLLKI